MNRAETLRFLAGAPLDVLIVGGGIVGAGIARDAAMRGLRTGLVERHDFASGASSRSSRLLHGGLRYLAQGRLGLVRQSSVEKMIIQRLAPHLVAPLPFLFPAYNGNPNWKLWQLKVGVRIYDLLCGGKNLGASFWLSTQAALDTVPGLCAENLAGAVCYYDGFTNDARLVFDTLRSAADHGAAVVNYTRFLNATRKKFWECELVDDLGGQNLSFQSRVVVNATGPWAGALPHSSVKLRPTKGVHLVIHRARLPLQGAVVMPEGSRILFAIPWGERLILGTTDTDYEGVPEDVATEPADVRSILEVANRYFPHAALAEGDVISSWAGLRPLLANPRGAPSSISRSHKIHSPEAGWWDVAGGKLTTYRLMAEHTVDQLVRELKSSMSSNGKIAPCRTADERLLPSPPRFSGLTPPDFCRAAVEHFCASEWAVHLDDVMIRRTSWQSYLPDARERAPLVANWMTEALGWTQAVRDAEIARLSR